MRITFDSIPICNGGSDSPVNMEVDGSRIVEVVDLPRAAAVKTFDRWNKETRITFERHVTESSYLAAQNRILTEHVNLPRKGDLVIVGEDGYQYQEFVLEGASLPRVRSKQHGVTVITTYEFVGGEISAG
jgi:hypothetical protein